MAQGLFLSRASALRVSPAPRCAGQGYRAWRAYACWVAMDPCPDSRSHPACRLLRRGFQSFFDTVCGARRLVVVQRHGGKLLHEVGVLRRFRRCSMLPSLRKVPAQRRTVEGTTVRRRGRRSELLRTERRCRLAALHDGCVARYSSCTTRERSHGRLEGLRHAHEQEPQGAEDCSPGRSRDHAQETVRIKAFQRVGWSAAVSVPTHDLALLGSTDLEKVKPCSKIAQRQLNRNPPACCRAQASPLS